MKAATAPPYLAPYVRAALRHGAGFDSLLWASPTTQAQRFDAIARLCDLQNKSILDVGCGRADLCDFLVERSIQVYDYIGLEAVDSLATAAEAKPHEHCRILRGDFVSEPKILFVGADVLIFSGSLNTLNTPDFYASLRRALDACAEAVVFNFLSSPMLAGRNFLTWHRTSDVLAFARSLCGFGAGAIATLSDYIDGDTTVLMRKQH